MLLLLSVAILAFFASYAEADTPANCSYGDIKGQWMLSLGKTGFTNQIDCNESFEPMSEVLVTLLFPDTAVDMVGNVGTWTLIYNQGFEIRLAGRIYFAFFKFKKIGKTTISICNTTFNGWVHNEVADANPVFPPTNWGCCYGKIPKNNFFDNQLKFVVVLSYKMQFIIIITLTTTSIPA